AVPPSDSVAVVGGASWGQPAQDNAAAGAAVAGQRGRSFQPTQPAQPAPAPQTSQPSYTSDNWAQQARELLDLHGLSLPEVSARFGIPSREIARAVVHTTPLVVQHPK